MMNQNDVATFTNTVTQNLYQLLVAQAKQMSFDEVQSNILANQIVPPLKPLIQSKLLSSTTTKATAAMSSLVLGPVVYVPQNQKFAKLNAAAKSCLEAYFAKL
jgi:hypothetical protein